MSGTPLDSKLSVFSRAWELPALLDSNIERVSAKPTIRAPSSQKPNGGGGFPIWTCPSFFVLLGPFPIFPGFSRFARGWCGDFPDWSFASSRPINSSHEEQSRKGPRHIFFILRPGRSPALTTTGVLSSICQSGPFPKKVGNPPVWNPPSLASLHIPFFSKSLHT